MDRPRIDLSWASSQLEGNTYTRLDTVALIEPGQAATGKAATETQMRSTQEYLTVKQGLAEPDPTRLRYRQAVKTIVARVVRSKSRDPMKLIRRSVADQVEQPDDRDQVASVVVQELRRLHEGVLARYGLRPSELTTWRDLKARP